MFDKILILLATVAMTVMPFFGPLIKKNTRNIFDKPTLNGYMFFFCAIVAVFLGTKSEIKGSIEELKKQKNSERLMMKVDSIKGSFEGELSLMSDRLNKFSDLSNTIDSINHSSAELLKERNNTLKKIENWNKKLNAYLKNDSIRFFLDKASIDFKGAPLQWIIIDDTTYQYRFESCPVNIGKRTARFIDYQLYLFLCFHNSEKIDEHLNIGEDFASNISIVSQDHISTNKCVRSKVVYSKVNLQNIPRIYAYLRLVYEDDLTTDRDTISKVLLWDKSVKAKTHFEEPGISKYEMVAKYMKFAKLTP